MALQQLEKRQQLQQLQLEQLIAQLQLYQAELLPLAQSDSDFLKAAFTAGEVTYLAYIESIETLITYRMAHLQLVRDYYRIKAAQTYLVR